MDTTSVQNGFSFNKRIQSFKFAFNGLLSFFEKEHNAWIHLLATLTVISLILIIPCSSSEITILVLAMGFVWTAELLNTAIERFTDLISTEHNPQIKFIKDISAAAVLIAALCAFFIGFIIFIPKIL